MDAPCNLSYNRRMSHLSPDQLSDLHPRAHPHHTLLVERSPKWVQKSAWLQRLLIAVTSVSISAKIMGIVLALTILLGLAVTVQMRSVMTNALQIELHNQGFATARDLADRAEPLVQSNDRAALAHLLENTLHNHLDGRYAFVLDNEGQIVASATSNGHGDENKESNIALTPDIVNADIDALTEVNSHLHYPGSDGHIHDFAIVLYDTGGETKIGSVRLGLAETRVVESISQLANQMWFTTLLIAGMGILAAMLLTWLLTRPILDLVMTTEQLRQGDLSARAPRWSDDEIGALADAFNQMVSELEASQQTVIEKETARTHLLSRLISAQEEERKRIARELHDGVGQTLTSILVHIKVLAQNQDDASQLRMNELHGLVSETLTDVRMLSRELRPSALDDLGLTAALERYMQEFNVRFPHLETDLHTNLSERLPPIVETSLYRIIQEAMTNAARHSRATSLSVLVNRRDGVVQAIIEDNGEGFDVKSKRRAGSSVGLHSMTERSELLNGTLEIESGSDGTTVYAEIPIAQNDQKAS